MIGYKTLLPMKRNTTNRRRVTKEKISVYSVHFLDVAPFYRKNSAGTFIVTLFSKNGMEEKVIMTSQDRL